MILLAALVGLVVYGLVAGAVALVVWMFTTVVGFLLIGILGLYILASVITREEDDE